MTSWVVTSFVLPVLSPAMQQLHTVSKGKDVGTAQNNPLYFKFDRLNGIIHGSLASYIPGNKTTAGLFFMSHKKLFGISQRRALRRLVANNRQRLYRMAYAWTSDPHLADDLVQQTSLKALNNQKQLRDFAAAEGWLFRILANCLTDYRRAKREFLSGDNLEIVDKITPEYQFNEEQLVQKVRQAVQKLPINHCQVITLVDLEEFSYASVAQILDIPVGTVMSRLCRGRRALREQLLEIKPGKSLRPAANIKRIK